VVGNLDAAARVSLDFDLRETHLLLTPVNKEYWAALAEGKLIYQRCGCGHRWLPPRGECPACLRGDAEWRPSRGEGQLVSWVIYHHAYHPALAESLPYNVAIIELTEGPRLIANIIDCPDGKGLSIGAAVAFDAAQSKRRGRAQFSLRASREIS
jgi:uncharacterized OB-fold protein